MVQKVMVNVYPIRYRNGRLEFLLIKRATVSYNWQCVTGSVGQSMGKLDHPEDESPMECAIRELLEETGYTPALIVPVETPPGIWVDDEPEGERITPKMRRALEEVSNHFFIALIDQQLNPVLNPVEHTDWKWCSFDTAYELIQWALEKKAIRIVNACLLKNPLNKKV